jgi:hypothetical protein
LNRIIILFLLIIFLGCNSQKNELEFEKEVFNEIFSELVDSTFYDFRLLPPPKTLPPPPNGTIISDSLNKENIKRHKKFLEEFEKRKIKIEKDTSRIVLAIVDTIFTLNQENFERLDEKFKNDSLEKKTEYKLNLSEFKNNKKFIFKYYSEFPKGRKIWRTEYPFHLGAVLSFSRIYFDNSKKNGILEGGVNYGILNGNGFKIFIQRVSGKWRIQKIEGTWIS